MLSQVQLAGLLPGGTATNDFIKLDEYEKLTEYSNDPSIVSSSQYKMAYLNSN